MTNIVTSEIVLKQFSSLPNDEIKDFYKQMDIFLMVVNKKSIPSNLRNPKKVSIKYIAVGLDILTNFSKSISIN